MKKCSVFDFTDFKDYLAERFSTVGDSRGMRIQFAKLIHASPSYVSKVLAGKIKLGLEHVPIIDEMLKHSDEESEFFMQLVLYSQAGSNKLEVYFKRNLDSILDRRRVSADWIPNKRELSEAAQARYYSHWYYTVVRVLTSVPRYQSKAAIAVRLKLSMSTVSQVLDYLVQLGLVEQVGERFRNTKNRMHQKKDSPWVQHAHLNMRVLGNQKLTEPERDDIQYSLVMGLSQPDVDLIRKKIKKMLEDFEPMLQSNQPEEAFVFTLDFFKV